MDVQRYYDDFSRRYDTGRDKGYHALIDELEAGLVRGYLDETSSVLEVGCGTGLILSRLEGARRRVIGVDLSRAMLRRARERSHHLAQADAISLPFEDESFDVVCSFKVLAHVPMISEALAELSRVVKRGGFLIVEFYNPLSLRYLSKMITGPRKTGFVVKESDVLTRWDPPWRLKSYLPSGVDILTMRGIRVLTPAAPVLSIPIVGRVLNRLERAVSSTAISSLVGGFVVAVARKG